MREFATALATQQHVQFYQRHQNQKVSASVFLNLLLYRTGLGWKYISVKIKAQIEILPRHKF